MKTKLWILVMMLTSVQLSAQKKKQASAASMPSEIRVPMVSTSWDFQPGTVDFIEYKGVQAARLNEKSGFILLKDRQFTNGTIEFDVEVNQASPFPTLYFHWLNRDETEHVYLRTGVAGKNNAFDAVQYASIINGVNMWDMQHEFQTSAMLKVKDWNHVKLVVSGKQLRVYVNQSGEPNLEIPCMEGNTSTGLVGLGTGFPGEAIFANLVVKPDATEDLSPVAGADITRHDTRYIRDWSVSKPDSLPFGREVFLGMMPKADAVWEKIKTERRGMVNLSRKFGNSNGRRYVWLGARIKSDMARTQVLKLGFSDEVWVFINGRPIYVDKNIYYLGMRKSPNGRISIDNASFDLPLKQGENELMIAVANDFYGWGIMARLENVDGIEVMP